MIARIATWRGPSEYDGTSITAYLAEHENTKTGPVMGLIVAPSTGSYWQHRKEGTDSAVCGKCPLSIDKTCYVGNGSNVGMGVQTTLKKLEGAPIYTASLANWLRGTGRRVLRSAVWGDAAALPKLAWLRIENAARSAGMDILGYTHGHLTLGYDRIEHLRSTHVVSADSIEEANEAVRQDWRYFRVAPVGTVPHYSLEFACPASAERNHSTTCNQCLACGSVGNSSGRKNVTIWKHDSLSASAARRHLASLRIGQQHDSQSVVASAQGTPG